MRSAAICASRLTAATRTARKIRIYFEDYPRRDTSRPAVSTIVSIEGGPGYSTTADRASRVALSRPISARRNLLLVDLRGTGRSGALDCPAFHQHILPYPELAGRCAAQLGARRDFYDTSQSVQDIEAVLVALHVGKVDLYGDSYGSYAAQAFALRYPWRLRSLVLDSTYQVPGSDPVLPRPVGAVADRTTPGLCPPARRAWRTATRSPRWRASCTVCAAIRSPAGHTTPTATACSPT